MIMSNLDERNAVAEVIQEYIDSTYYADIAKLKNVFHEKAVMNGYLGPTLLLSEPSLFIEDIAGNPSMESNNDPYNAEVKSINIEGNVASAAISETGFRGDAALVDFFHLIKTDGKWKIISKLFTTI